MEEVKDARKEVDLRCHLGETAGRHRRRIRFTPTTGIRRNKSHHSRNTRSRITSRVTPGHGSSGTLDLGPDRETPLVNT